MKVATFTQDKIKSWIPEIGKLRIEIFAEYPFLYDGSYDYELEYLKKFLTMEEAIVACAFNQNELIGIATGYPFVYETASLQKVFVQKNDDPKQYFCIGEIVLKKSYRGQGIGKQFVHLIENYAKEHRYPKICLYTVIRDPCDPKSPPNYIPLDLFWKNQGYVKHPELVGQISWKEIGELNETPKQMVFWVKSFYKFLGSSKSQNALK